MQTFRNPVFILCLLLAVGNQALELSKVYIWPLHTHLDDLLALPLTLTVALAAERLYFKNPYFVLPKQYTLLALLLFSVVFEGLLPRLHNKYTADAWDVLAYMVGALIFQVWLNKPLARQHV
ncbi:magnesium citrate secondary transporter [uncultured Pontibacter sp.]|uniref:magnesium citrate secondary transporter n=1 Tax=uncultured Pontibacter sp. TaxID=453356 RepID=UPI002619F6EF|nr:magnesium citrate secondary transporter [uncultured Pontibacter sp.]